MSIKAHLVSDLDSSVEYQVIGLDLAKWDTSVAAITDDGDLIGIDRLSYDKLFEIAEKMSPTVFAMEPCNGMNWLVNMLESYGHECKVISGALVKDYVKTHFSGQKNDLNDAQAIAFLAEDQMLKFIRAKAPSEMTLQAIQTIRHQLIKQRTCLIVCLKGISQGFGVNIAKALMSLPKLTQIVEECEKLPEEIKKPMLEMLKNVKVLEKQIKLLDKAVKEALKNNEKAKKLLEIPGFGTQSACRLLCTIGNIERFEGPKNLVAYYGLVPQSHTTGHEQRMGKLTKHGDRLMRSYVVQGANSLLAMHARGRLKKSPLKKWIDKKLNSSMCYQKVACALAAKLLRIAYAVLKFDEKFSLEKAGVAKCSLKTQA